MTRRVIIDTDPGQDDALAILVALASPELDVVAVTTVAGNVPQPLVTDNALALVELAGASDVPVYRGCERPLLRELYTAEYVHGPTGIDGAGLPAPSTPSAHGHAVDAIIEACLDAGPDGITLCPLGPLTNIGMAIAKEPAIVPNIREIVWMGGAFDEPGNTTALAEFNAFVDPHAAHIVFTSGVPVTVFPLDVTHQALMLPRHVERLEAKGNAAAVSAAGMVRFYETYDVEKYDIPGAPLHDPCVIAYLVSPDLFTGTPGAIAIDHWNEDTIGNTYVEPTGVENGVVMRDVDAEGFFDLVIERIGSL
jgi:purine nucleosidase